MPDLLALVDEARRAGECGCEESQALHAIVRAFCEGTGAAVAWRPDTGIELTPALEARQAYTALVRKVQR